MIDKKQSAKRAIFIIRSLLIGKTLKETAKIVGLSPERIAQIFRKYMRISSHPSRHTIEVPVHKFTSLTEARKYKDFWFKKMEELEIEFS